MQNFKSRLILLLLATLIFFGRELPAQSPGFIQNKGQVMDQNGQSRLDVQFLLPLPDMNVVLRTGGFSYDTYLWEAPVSAARRQRGEAVQQFQRIDIDLKGACPTAKWQAKSPQGMPLHYYNAVTGKNGAQNVHQYKKVICQGIYPHIDLEFVVGGKKPVEYNFILHPGARLADIELVYQGAGQMEMRKGKIALALQEGNIVEEIPASYFLENEDAVDIEYEIRRSKKGELAIGFVGLGSSFSGEIKETLVIDPAPLLVWASYYGGTADDDINAVATDSLGNVIVAGYTESANAIATSGAYQTSLVGVPNAFVAKMDSNGLRQWATYYGGSLTEVYAMTVGPQGKIFVTGLTTDSSGIATSGASQPNIGGASDAFLLRLAANGLLEWATYFGGLGPDKGRGIAVDAQHNVFLGGTTESGAGIATANSHQAVTGGLGDCFLAKWNAAGQLQWATYYGGTDTDRATGIGLAANGDVLICGSSLSANGIATSGAHQVSNNGNGDGFLARFTSNGSRVFGTFLGGVDGESIEALALDGSGNAFVTGYSNSSTGIATPGSWQPNISPPGTGDAFLVKFSPAGQRIWGTYFGGPTFDGGFAIESDAAGNTHFGGLTASTSGIASPGAFQANNAGAVDGFVAHFSAAGNQIWSTYLGGTAYDLITGITQSPFGQLYVCGNTTSSNWLATNGSHQATNGGLSDGFFLHISTCQTPDSIHLSLSSATTCIGDSLNLQLTGNLGQATQWQWYSDSCGGTTAGTGISLSIAPSQATTYYVRGEGGCVINALCTQITVNPVQVDTSITVGSTSLTANATPATYQWLNCTTQQILPNATQQTFSPTSVGTYAAIITQSGCTDTSTCYTLTTVHLQKPGITAKLYPNPSAGKFTLKASLPSNLSTLSIYNPLGQLIKTDKIAGNTLNKTYNLENVASGIYKVQLHSGEHRHTFTLIRQ